MEDLQVYRARPSDLAAILPLVREFCAVDGHEYDEARVARALAPLLAGDVHGQVWLVGVPGVADVGAAAGPAVSGAEAGVGVAARGAVGVAVCGYAVLTWGWSLESGGREALLDEIYVRERGRGAGSLLLQQVIAAAGRAGAFMIFLETEAHNERVRGFYARHGFAVENSVWMRRAVN
ncbi:GNAT family N-acetyltransferase [Dactylosporangium sp. CA-233914]|uniref:GNAT family N-acetyltransferase n=1 Tax=Dactylosporangium sp. CA-233914 TaxID=3239934 RepID=UPI003D8F1428